jgi:hypothetical protein
MPNSGLAPKHRIASRLRRVSAAGARRLERAIARAALHRGMAVVFVGFFSLAVNLGIASMAGINRPHVHDEFSYVLAADTFAHGRLANPTHPCWPHFETMHVLQRPTYASKFPPAQGLFLAFGKLVAGEYIVGAWLAGALACAAVCWMLMAWVKPRLAFFGGLIVSLHPMVLIWGQSYWGGALAMLGGSLLLGGMRRTLDLASAHSAFAMGLGMAILAITRPFEGFVLTLLSLAALLISTGHRAGLSGVVRSLAILPILIVPVGIALAWLGFYNAAVTGSPTRLPYVAYESQYSVAPFFLFASPPRTRIEFSSPEFARFDGDCERGYYSQRSMAIPKMLGWSVILAGKSFFPLLAVVSKSQEQSEGWWEMARSLPVVVLQLPLFIFPCIFFSRVARFPALMLGAFTCGQALATWKSIHYGAPAFGLMMVLTLQSIRLWRRWKWGRWRVGRFAQRIAMVGCVLWPVMLFVVWPAIKVRPHFGHDRFAVDSGLLAKGERHLIIVRYGPLHNQNEEWVYNEADIDRAAVVWARDLGAEKNRKLLDYFKDRHLWLLEPDESRVKLVPYSGSRDENGPVKAVSPDHATQADPVSPS